jgi:hypothetical protein
VPDDAEETRVRFRLTVLVLLLAGLSVVPAGGASGSCAGPTLTTRSLGEGPPTLYVGGLTEVAGRYFVHGCDDTGTQPAFGCGGSGPRDEETPMRDVVLRLVQGDRSWVLGRADAGTAEEGRLGQVSWTFRVPMAAKDGPATLRAGMAELRVAVGGRLHHDPTPQD